MSGSEFGNEADKPPPPPEDSSQAAESGISSANEALEASADTGITLQQEADPVSVESGIDQRDLESAPVSDSGVPAQEFGVLKIEEAEARAPDIVALGEGCGVDYSSSHAEEFHGADLTIEDLESRLADNAGLEYATKFDSQTSLDNARSQFATDNFESMLRHAQEINAALAEGETLGREDYRYVETIDAGAAVGDGISRDGEFKADIQSVTGVYDYNPYTGSFQEVTIYPNADADEQRKGRL